MLITDLGTSRKSYLRLLVVSRWWLDTYAR